MWTITEEKGGNWQATSLRNAVNEMAVYITENDTHTPDIKMISYDNGHAETYVSPLGIGQFERELERLVACELMEIVNEGEHNQYLKGLIYDRF